MDKDDIYLDNLSDQIHRDWQNSLITNVVRSALLDAVQEVRDNL